MSSDDMFTEARAQMKVVNLTFAFVCFGAATALLATADGPLDYLIAVWNLMGTALMVWQGRLWK